MQWNEFDYETQQEVIDRIGDLMLKQKDDHLQFALAAAMVELDMWSNSPCPTMIGNETGPFAVEATDPYPEDE